jgi:beta-phosphoglucomutase-like phosphatase (HAD superfamily)
MPATPTAELAIFDHDGVLVDPIECHQEAWFELERRAALSLTPEFVHATLGMTNPGILRRLRGPPSRRRRALSGVSLHGLTPLATSGTSRLASQLRLIGW